MRINSHAHGVNAERNAAGELCPPVKVSWTGDTITPQEYIETGKKEYGIENFWCLTLPMWFLN